MHSSAQSLDFRSVSDYISSAQGISDLFDLVNYAAQYARVLPLSIDQLELAGKVSHGFAKAADALYLVDLVSYSHRFSESVKEAWSARQFQFLHVKNITYTALLVTAAAVDSSKFALGVIGKVLAPRFQALGAGAAFITDSVDLKNQVSDLVDAKRMSDRTTSSRKLEKIYDNTKLTLLKMTQTISFIALDVLSMVALVYTFYGIGTMFLGFSTVVVTTSVAIHFFGLRLKNKGHA